MSLMSIDFACSATAVSLPFLPPMYHHSDLVAPIDLEAFPDTSGLGRNDPARCLEHMRGVECEHHYIFGHVESYQAGNNG